jgi:hypothetical protein
MYYAESDEGLERTVEAVTIDSEPLAETPEVAVEPTMDLDKIWRTLDRPLLMLALGAQPDEVKGLPLKGLDGKPYVFEATVEVTLLIDRSASSAELRKALEAVGFTQQGKATSGSVIVGRIAIAKLLDAAELELIRRIVPTS